jgi:hypothetical protein
MGWDLYKINERIRVSEFKSLDHEFSQMEEKDKKSWDSSIHSRGKE